MNKNLQRYVKLAPFLAVGLVAAAALVGGILYVQRGAHIEMNGSIQKVRTLALDENSSAVFLDFRIQNPADYPFMVKDIAVTMVDAKGNTLEGSHVSDADARRLFQYYPALGQKYNDGLAVRSKIPPRQTWDRMLSWRFDIPEKELQARKGLKVRIEEVDGAVVEFAEGQKAP